MDYDGALQSERQVLLQEQKACRVRAYKFHLETSRRRKALEDRRRQWDMQEQQIRDNILQVRKQRMQDATERFQRAHIRPSQRRRPAFVKRTVNIDEALSIIDGRGPYAKTSPALLTNTSASRNGTPPPMPQTFSNPGWHQREQVPALSSAKLEDRQRNYRASQPFFLDGLQERKGSVKDEESPYTWEEEAGPPSPIDSLSSQDSLEVEELKHRQKQQQQMKYGGRCQASPTPPPPAPDKDSPPPPPPPPQTHHPSRAPRPSSATRHHHHHHHHATTNHQASSVTSSPAHDYSEPRPPFPPPPSLREDLVKPMGSSLHGLSSAAAAHPAQKEPSPDTQEQGTLGSHGHCYPLRAQDNVSHMTRHGCTRAASEGAEVHREAVSTLNHHHHHHHLYQHHHHNHGKTTPARVGCRSTTTTTTELTCWEQECRTVCIAEQQQQQQGPLRGQGEDESEYRLTTAIAAGATQQVRQTSSGNGCKQPRDTSYKTFVSVVEAITQRALASDNQTSGAAAVPPVSPHHSSSRPPVPPQQPPPPPPHAGQDAGHRREEEESRLHSRTPSNCSLTTGSCVSNCTLPIAAAAAAAEVKILKSILKKRSKYEMEASRFMHTPGHLIITKHMAMSLRDSIELIRGKGGREPENSKQTRKKKLRWFDEVNGKNQDNNSDKDSTAVSTPAKSSRPPVPCNHHHLHHQGLNQLTSAYVDGVSATISTVPSTPQGSSARQAWADVATAVGDNRRQQEPSHPHSSQPPSQPHQVAAPKVQRNFLCSAIPRVPRRVRSARVGPGLTPSCVRKDLVSRPHSASEAGNALRNQKRATAAMAMVPCPPPRPEAGQADRQTVAAPADSQTNRPSAADCRNAPHRHRPEGHMTCPPDDSPVLPHAPCPPPASSESGGGGGQKPRVSFGQHGSHVGARRCGAACEENGICLNRTPTDDEIALLWSGLRSVLSSKDDRVSQALFPDPCMIGDVRSLAGMRGSYLSPSNGVVRRPMRRPQEANGSKNKRMPAQHPAQIPGSASKKLSATNQPSLMTMPLPREVPDQGPLQRTGHPAALSLSGLSLEEQRVQQSLDRLNQRLQCVVADHPSMKRLLHPEGSHQISTKFGDGVQPSGR
ncbi:centrosomal protein of 126 kDa [Engraulis encrasicolus]|uniref:centrosomal protein of 126 kDa n=1 Tax=Engraulis encrasicolus TaxID=184585 RepID=UPI002FD4D0B8